MAHFVKLENGTYLNIDVISRITENNTAYTIGEQNPWVFNLTDKDVENILDATGYYMHKVYRFEDQ